ncbi:MAG: IclR family transcriptional regulator [Rhodobacteraceae bacterium]|nr:IclR family transcriptional regulator [Paracoccaceae bacterium]
MPSTRQRGRPKSFTPNEGQTIIQSLDRAIDVLQVLAESGGLTLSEIAAALDQSPATIYRVLSTFEARHIAEPDPVNQTWHVGPAAFRLGAAFLRRTNVVERARPVMRELMEATGETANLGIENGGQVLFVSQVETHESIRAFFPPGTQSPLHASGIGKALLSCLPEDRLEAVLTGEMHRFTDSTITDPAAMRADLEAIRARGYALDDEERTSGMRCIAAPVRNHFGEAVAGVSVSGPTHRVTPDRVDALGALVREAARAISHGLGAPGT